MAVQVGGSVVKERRGGQAGARIGAGPRARNGADVTDVGGEAALPERALPVRVWRSWLRHWLLYAEVVGAQWR